MHEQVNALITRADQHQRLRDDAGRLASCLEQADLATPVAACPGWDLRTLGVHTAYVHRWATRAAQTGAPPGPGDIDEPAADADADNAALGAWMRTGADAL
ncbi:maleylpyruvate isomerase N-terminal domain-containing protein, partial [Ilumatobacter sp.]|uniref:maleylpyruvate isomerase N-terminal domain-containing protein n=1 Tax=Ilumatobacter sp. TaxID=1967498 RepID=UPI003C40DCAF